MLSPLYYTQKHLQPRCSQAIRSLANACASAEVVAPIISAQVCPIAHYFTIHKDLPTHYRRQGTERI